MNPLNVEIVKMSRIAISNLFILDNFNIVPVHFLLDNANSLNHLQQPPYLQ